MGEPASSNLIVNIRPPVSVYATFRRLSYRPWYALAEFVDNSTQNFIDHRQRLLQAYREEGAPNKLRIEIEYDSEKNGLVVYDNAHGMKFDELARALVLNRPPPDISGRCEYGMGLKTAACWFGRTWTIETTRLGDSKELKVTVHVPDLTETGPEQVLVTEASVARRLHYTRITIDGLYKPIQGRTLGKIREMLGSMYREDIRSGDVQIQWNGEPIAFDQPPILVEDLARAGKSMWRKEVRFEVPSDSGGESLGVKGWIGIRNPGSQRDAGFALLRRGRVIVGGPGENYKPDEVFGQGNTFRSQRLIGELHLDEWPVTQAKDAFDWSGGLEEAFVDRLRVACQDYMEKAEAERWGRSKKAVSDDDMKRATEDTRRAVEDARFGAAIAEEVTLPTPPKTPEQEKSDLARLRGVSQGPIVYRVHLPDMTWEFRLNWQEQLSDAHWMTVSYPQDDVTDVFLNMAHPFFEGYLDDQRCLELLQRFVIALALAERMARKLSANGLVSPANFRNFMNRVLRYASEIEGEAGA
jgi:hypothetical protein